MADEKTWHQKVLEKVMSYFPPPISGAAKESSKSRGRVQGTTPNKMDEAIGEEPPPPSEGKSTGDNRDQPRQKFYK